MQTSSGLVKRAVECPICLEIYKNPKLLDCIHSCCEGCVAKHASGSPPVMKCPECRRETVLKGSSAAAGAAALPTNYAINGVVEALAQEAREANADRCQGCVDEAPADWRCDVCAVVLCNECCYMHSRSKATAAHETCSIATPSIKGPPKAQTNVAGATGSGGGAAAAGTGPKLCADHGEPLKIFCCTHKKPICLCANHGFPSVDCVDSAHTSLHTPGLNPCAPRRFTGSA